jgi:hypothetical protein
LPEELSGEALLASLILVFGDVVDNGHLFLPSEILVRLREGEETLDIGPKELPERSYTTRRFMLWAILIRPHWSGIRTILSILIAMDKPEDTDLRGWLHAQRSTWSCSRSYT